MLLPVAVLIASTSVSASQAASKFQLSEKKRLMALFLYLRLKTKIYIDVLNGVFCLINETVFLFFR